MAFRDPYGLSPDGGVLEVGVGGAAILTGIAITATALLAGDELGDALEQGYEAGRDLVVGVFGAIKAKVLEVQANGQMKPIAEHFGKLSNPNQPGGDDPRNRQKWKDDIRRAVDRLRTKVDKMKGKQKEKWEDIIKQTEERLGAVE